MNVLDDLRKLFDVDGWEIMGSYAEKFVDQTLAMVGVLFILVAIISVLASIIRTIIKFYDFTLEETLTGWRVSYGLLTKKEKLLPLNKIQVLSWKANWVRRKLNFWILTVQSIGHSRAQLRQHVHIPVTSINNIFRLTGSYQQSPVFDVDIGLMIEPDYWKRKIIFFGLPVTLLLTGLLYLWLGTGALWLLLLIIYFAWYFNTWYKNFRWYINDEGLQLHAGVWGRKHILLTWKKVQQVHLTQSPYQRSHELASLTFITAGGNVNLPYIKVNDANQLVDLCLFYVESREDSWM
jgi:putative membrane protein